MGILKKPVITEKTNDESELRNRFTFVVDRKAKKPQIKKVVEDAYGVTVEKVNTMNVGPRRKTRYTQTGVNSGKTSGYKKAVVKIAEGDTIDLYANI